MTKVLITGGAGYIGTALATRLINEGHDVTVLDNLYFGSHALHHLFPSRRFHFIRQDVRDVDLFKMPVYHVVVNLAAYSLPLCEKYPDTGMAINRDASLRLAKQCDLNDCHFIFPSTCSNYGVRTNGFATEDSPLDPTSVYAKSKVDVETGLRESNVRCTILRFATAYGLAARFRSDLILHEFIKDALIKGRIALRGAFFYRPLVHVDDITRAISLVISKKEYGTFNIGSTADNYTKMELAEMVQKVVACMITVDDANSDPRNYMVDFRKAEQELGFAVQHNIKSEIAKIVNAYRQGALTFDHPQQ